MIDSPWNQTPMAGTDEQPASRSGAKRSAMLPRPSVPGSLASLRGLGERRSLIANKRTTEDKAPTAAQPSSHRSQSGWLPVRTGSGFGRPLRLMRVFHKRPWGGFRRMELRHVPLTAAFGRVARAGTQRSHPRSESTRSRRHPGGFDKPVTNQPRSKTARPSSDPSGLRSGLDDGSTATRSGIPSRGQVPESTAIVSGRCRGVRFLTSRHPTRPATVRGSRAGDRTTAKWCGDRFGA